MNYEIRNEKAVGQEKHQRSDDGTGQESHQTGTDTRLWQAWHGHLTSQEGAVQPGVPSYDLRVGRHHQDTVQVNSFGIWKVYYVPNVDARMSSSMMTVRVNVRAAVSWAALTYSDTDKEYELFRTWYFV